MGRKIIKVSRLLGGYERLRELVDTRAAEIAARGTDLSCPILHRLPVVPAGNPQDKTCRRLRKKCGGLPCLRGEDAP